MNQYDPPGRFTQCPIHMPRETAQSYLGRITAFFGAESPKQFCKEFFLDLKGIQHGESEALQRFAAMTGARADELVRSTPRRITNAFMELAGETLHTKLNPRHLISICPLCAKEDIAANPGIPLDQAVFGRCEWMVNVVGICHKHQVKLVSHRAPVRTAEKLDVGYETGHLLEELPFIDPEPAEIDDFQRYVLSRIGVLDPTPSPLLDGLPLVQVTQLCHAAGLDLLLRRGKTSSPSDAERRAAGFEMLGHGADHLERVFLEMREGMVLSEMTASFVPRLQEYLYDSALVERDLGKFVDVFVDICFRNLPYAEGAILVARRCPKRTLHDFMSAMETYSIARHHLTAFIIGHPDFVAYAGKRREDCLIHANVADALFKAKMPLISQTEAARRIGVDPTKGHAALQQLTAAGVISSECGVTAEGVAFYSEPEFEAATKAFLARFEVTSAITGTMRSVFDIVMTYRVGYRDLWRMMASGQFRRVGLVPDEPLLKGIRLETEDLFEALTGVREVLTTNQAAAMLTVFNHDVSNLVVNGKLPTLRIQADIPVKLLHVFNAQVIQDFGMKHISRREFCKLLGRQLSVETLRRQGLEPEIELESQFARRSLTVFYRRDAALDFIANH